MGRRLGRWRPLRWLAALLGASVLTSGFLPTRAQPSSINITVTWEPAEPFVGGDVTLTPGGKPGFGSCIWSRWRGEKNYIFVYFPPPSEQLHTGPDYSEREIPGPKCSLRITSLTLEDSGIYMVTKDGTDFDTEEGEARIKVHGTVSFYCFLAFRYGNPSA
ncbi:UNVERIFIED_CONTAM: hypothetical protein K2H54_031707 [Gekko kuhli]